MKILVVVDMQNDFINGAFGNSESKTVVPKVVDLMKNFEGLVICTRDTHTKDYLGTLEGRNTRIAHCIKGTEGWMLYPEIASMAGEVIDKKTYGSIELAQRLKGLGATEVTLAGLSLDISIISNAMILRTYLPETTIKVVASCCAGRTEEGGKVALEAMKSCNVEVI